MPPFRSPVTRVLQSVQWFSTISALRSSQLNLYNYISLYCIYGPLDLHTCIVHTRGRWLYCIYIYICMCCEPSETNLFSYVEGTFLQGLMIHFSPPLSLAFYIHPSYIHIVNTVQDSKIVYDTQCRHAYLHMILLPACSWQDVRQRVRVHWRSADVREPMGAVYRHFRYCSGYFGGHIFPTKPICLNV